MLTPVGEDGEQDWIPSDLQYRDTLFTYDCGVQPLADAALIGLISNEDKTAYRSEVAGLVEQCHNDNFILNMTNMKEVTVDFILNTPVVKL